MRLSAKQVAAARPADVRYSLGDGRGLSLRVTPNGTKTWAWAYRFGGNQRKTLLGAYPGMALADARAERDRLRALLAEGHDPAAARAVRPRAPSEEDLLGPDPGTTWKEVCREYFDKRRDEGAAPATLVKLELFLSKTFAGLGDRPVAEIRAKDLLAVLREEELKGHFETAVRLRTNMGQVFRYAVATDRAERDVAADLRDALRAPRPKSHAGITEPEKIGGLVRAVVGYGGSAMARIALRIQAYCFCRPAETRMARWAEFDLGEAIWRIPGARMKMDRDHIVPLSTQAVAALEWLRPFTAHHDLVFPQARQPERPISENTMNAALLNMGFARNVQVPHGFRSTASTSLNEAGWPPDWIEVQLAHTERNRVRGAYNAALYLDGRRDMMQRYADWLDALAAGEKIGHKGLAPRQEQRYGV